MGVEFYSAAEQRGVVECEPLKQVLMARSLPGLRDSKDWLYQNLYFYTALCLQTEEQNDQNLTWEDVSEALECPQSATRYIETFHDFDRGTFRLQQTNKKQRPKKLKTIRGEILKSL